MIVVDDMQRSTRVGRLPGVWSHMMSDLPGSEGTAELIEFAERLGLRRDWIQYEGKPTEHFDLTEPKRQQAIKMGARQIHYGREGAAITQIKIAARNELRKKEIGR